MSRRWLFPWQWDVVQDDGPHPHVYTTRARPGRPALCFDGRDNADSPYPVCSESGQRGLEDSTVFGHVTCCTRLTLNTVAPCPGAQPAAHARMGRPGGMVRVGAGAARVGRLLAFPVKEAPYVRVWAPA